MNTKSRPVHLDLTRMKFPPMAIVSILHRLSGVVLFLLLPFAIYMLHASLFSEASFTGLQQMLLAPEWRFLMWVLLSAVGYHFLAGVRHMLMDCGIAESLCHARLTAYVLIVLQVIVMLLLGVWLC